MDLELAAALEPVLRDLSGPGGVVPEVRDESWVDQPQTASAFLYAADGSGTGIWITRGLAPATQVAAVADQVQEWAVEALWSAGRSTSWPACPRHPESHPLTAAEKDGRPVWMCPTTRAVLAEVGQLTDRAG
jgi:hypothetical protein